MAVNKKTEREPKVRQKYVNARKEKKSKILKIAMDGEFKSWKQLYLQRGWQSRPARRWVATRVQGSIQNSRVQLFTNKQKHTKQSYFFNNSIKIVLRVQSENKTYFVKYILEVFICKRLIKIFQTCYGRENVKLAIRTDSFQLILQRGSLGVEGPSQHGIEISCR
jgi:hypothetical protein